MLSESSMTSRSLGDTGIHADLQGAAAGPGSPMKKSVRDNLDVLQNIGMGIVTAYRADRSLLDADAQDAIDALIRPDRAEEGQRTPPIRTLGERAKRMRPLRFVRDPLWATAGNRSAHSPRLRRVTHPSVARLVARPGERGGCTRSADASRPHLVHCRQAVLA